VNESTSAGILVISGNVFAILFIVAYSVMKDPVTVTLLLIIVYTVNLMQLLPFRPKLLRLEFEQNNAGTKVN
jgi:hypothetical protein